MKSHISVLIVLAALVGAPAVLPAIPTAGGRGISDTLQNILANTDRSDKYHYPTDLTRGIRPKPIHSHNDYWRDLPFYTALSVGCVSVEADVWLINSTLYVGHEPSALISIRTFTSLYIDPILDVLTRENPTTPFVPTKPSSTPHGIFDGYSDVTLYLWVDVKNTGSQTWPAVVAALQPLRDTGYLTRYEVGMGITMGPVTVIGTGETPLDQVAGAPSRDYFYDAPLESLESSQYENITREISPIASTDFTATIGRVVGTALTKKQLETLRGQIAYAHSKGIGTRYWDLPAWPISTRNAVWRILVDEGVDLLNADDVAEAAGFGAVDGYW